MQTNRSNLSAIRALITFIFMAVALLAPAMGQSAPALFATEATAAESLTGSKAPKGFKRARLAKISPTLLQGAASPLRKVAAESPKVALNLFGDKELPVTITATQFKAEREYVSFGVVDGKKESHVILAVNGDVIAGTVFLPGENPIQITYAGEGLHQVGEIASDELPGCGTQEVGHPNVAGGDVVPAIAGDAVSVDVMVVYTAAARAGAGGTAAMNALIDAAIAEANTTYSNSLVGLTLNLVYRGEIAYTESGNATTDLTRMQSGENSQLAPILALRSTYGADVVTLVTESMASYAGLGFVMSPVSSSFAPHAFNVVRRQYMTGTYVYAHEVGHNMGCMHDRNNASSAGAFDYSYGYRFEASSVEYRTVMAYAPGLRIPYFSNPDVTYGGVATGIAAGATNSANNALSLSNAIPTVASFYSSGVAFNLDETEVTANEDDGTVTLTVNLTGTASTNVTVNYTTVAVSATAGSDYTAASGTLTFTNGVTSRTITVTLLNNSTVETNETFKVNLASPTGGPVIGPKSSATVTVVDDDIGITLASAMASVGEGDTNIVVTVNRSGGLTNTVTVDFAMTDISATGGTDYTNSNGTLTFTNGVTSQAITIPIVDDSTIESNETFRVTLSNPSSGVTLISPTNTLVTIVENDSSLTFTTNTVSPGENATVTLTVTRTGGTTGTVTVDYLTADGTADAGADYTNTSGTLTFTNGVTSRTITVPLINDSDVEGNEDFTVGLTNPTGGAAFGSYTNVTATIRDNDSIFNFATNALTRIENGGTVTLSVVRTGGVIGAATVRYAATNGSASSGTDFKAFTGTISFAAGETNKTVALTLLDDTAVETNETLTVGLNTATGEASIGTNDVATVTIEDNDSLVGFASSTLSVDEAATNVTLTIERSGTLTLTNTVAYTFAAGSAGSADFRGTNGVLTFSPGDTNKTITFAILDDSSVETNETFRVTLSAPSGGALITGTNAAVVTIVETDVGLGFAATTYSVAEDGTNVVLTVNRTGATNETVTIDFATLDGSAVDGNDYTNTSGTLTFTNGVASQTITVPITNDSTAETNETFKVTLSNADGAFIIGGTNATVTILEEDGTISLGTNAVAVIETATNVVLTVVRTGGTNTTMTVEYFTTDDSATDGGDYTSTTGTLTFGPGVKTKTISVPLSNDSSVEGDETFSLTLTNAAGGAALGSVTDVTVTVRDNDSVFSVATNEITVAETALTASITVVRTGGVVAAATVAFASTNDTATAGSDYTAAAGTLSFAAGETNKTFTVKITNDTSHETNETFTVGLKSPTGEGALSTNSVVTLTITDNDSTISFETNAVTVAESAGTVSLNIVRTGTLSLTNSIAYSFKAGSATSADFTATNGILTFLPNETNKTIVAAIINDSTIETNETFTLTLASPSGGALIGGTNIATITITENDAAVSWLATTASVWEDETNVVLTVKRTGDTTSTVTVDYATADISTASGDYTNTSGTLTFTNGVTSLTIEVPIVEDSTVESNETFRVTLSGVTGGVISGSTNSVVTIREEDSAFTLASTTYSGREGTNVIVTLTRIGNTNTSFGATLVSDYTGAATNLDFTAVNTNLTFSTGQVSVTFAVALTKDAVVDTNETFDVQIQTLDSGFEAVSPTNAVVTIIDNTGSLQFAATNYTVLESATNVVLTVTRTGGTNNTLSVDYVTADGSASAGSDYTAQTNTLSFAAGQASKTISIPLTNDSSVEGDEDLTVTLSNPDGAVLGSNTETTINIRDNDSVIAVSTNAITVAETALKANVTVTRAGGLAAAATVHYATTNDTATAGSDYTALSGTLTFAAGETNKVLSITVINDTSYETNETFSLVLSSPTAEATLSTNDTTTITLTDNDSTISWETNTTTVAESAGTVTLTVNRTGTLSLTNSVVYQIKAGTAGVADYTATNGILTFLPNETNKTITAAIVDDAIVESTETFSVVLSAPAGGAAIGGTNATYITITENDIGLAWSSATTTISEAGTNVVLTVNRAGSTNGTVTVDYSFTDITATNSVDYAGTNGSLSFTNGVTSLTVEVPITDDSWIEANETFRVSLSNISGGILTTVSNTVVTIIEDDSSIAFTTNAVSVAETITNITLTVKRTGGTNSTVTVDFVTADVSATDGADYDTSSIATNTLTFNPGQLTKTISVPLANDSSVEGDETFTLSLTNLSGTSVVFGSYSNATVTIKDNDSVFNVLTNAASVAENVGTAVITIRRTGGTVATATVQYAAAAGTASATTDYTTVAGTLTFKPGETNKTVAVKITNDTTAETDETLTVTLTNPTGESTVGTNNVTTVTIVDNDFAIGDVFGSVQPVTILNLGWNANGEPVVTVGGPLGSYAIVDVSSDLTNWEEITATSIQTGTIQVTDSAAASSSARFYRLRAPSEE